MGFKLSVRQLWRVDITLKKVLLATIIPILLLFSNTSICQANAAPPPTILIIVQNAPRDLEISIENQTIKGRRTDNPIESYFAFYAFDLKSGWANVTVTTGGKTFEASLGSDIAQKPLYTNVFTLDLASHTLTPGKASLLRSVSLLSLQVLLTMIIEGIVFLLVGYRKKRSWFVFVTFNLLTQGILYLWLAQIHQWPPNNIYIVFSLIFGEILVFAVEMVGFLVFINERSRGMTAGYVFGANLASLIAGSYIIMALPVYF
jgi:hypothetical protein